MPWGIAAGIVPKNAFSENREFQTFDGVCLVDKECIIQGLMRISNNLSS